MPPAPRDDTTRLLAATTHLNPAFAEQVIREFLLVPTRPVPPSPGYDSGAVLVEAVAARTRTRRTDLAALGVVVVAAVVLPPWLISLWIVLSVLGMAAGFGAKLLKATEPGPVRGLLVGGAVALALIAFVATGPDELGEALESLTGAISGSVGGLLPWLLSGHLPEELSTLLTLAVLGGAFAVLLRGRFAVWRLMTTRFARGRWRPSTVEAELDSRKVFDHSPFLLTERLRQRYGADREPTWATDPSGVAADVPVVVHRGHKPFVGAGRLVSPWSIAVPLVRDGEREAVAPLSTSLLYDSVVAALTGLRDADALAPSLRLQALVEQPQVVVSAVNLLDHLDDAESTAFLGSEPDTAPYDRLSRSRLDRLRERPLEWARYYQTFRVESWHRDIVVSVYLHVAMDAAAIYLEWAPCVLLPLRAEFRAVDSVSRSPGVPLTQALGDLVVLPATLPARFGRVFSRLRPAEPDPDVPEPERYGCAASIRELAQAGEVSTYFQLADIERYVKLMASRLVIAVKHALVSAGYSAASFEEQTSAVVTNNITIGGSFSGAVLSGTTNQVVGGVRTTDSP